MKDKKNKVQKASNPPGGFPYFFGMIGSAVYFIQQIHGFWLVILALLKALVWPAFLIYDLFKFLVH